MDRLLPIAIPAVGCKFQNNTKLEGLAEAVDVPLELVEVEGLVPLRGSIAVSCFRVTSIVTLQYRYNFFVSNKTHNDHA